MIIKNHDIFSKKYLTERSLGCYDLMVSLSERKNLSGENKHDNRYRSGKHEKRF
jgi:hypothetical protein